MTAFSPRHPVVCAAAAAILSCGARAAELRADFSAGVGLDGWTSSADGHVSPAYSNSVRRISLEHSGGGADGRGTVYARSAGGETPVAAFTSASSAASFDFPEDADFRGFRVATSGGLVLDAFVALVPSVKFRACALSSLPDGVYAQDFDALARVVPSGSAEWENCVTLPYWQAWQNDTAATSLGYTGGKASTAGFYALAADPKDPVRAFGAHPKKGMTMSWCVAFTNDTAGAMLLKGVSYVEQQWGFANSGEMAFACSWLVADRFDDLVGFADGWHVFRESSPGVYAADEPHSVPVAEAVAYAPADEVRIEPGEVLFVRWRLEPPKSGSSALMGIDDLRIAFAPLERPFLMQVCTSDGGLASRPDSGRR